MSDYPQAPCKKEDIHQTHIHVDNGTLERCPGVGDNEEYVYRLVDAETGIPNGRYKGQHVYKDPGPARAQVTRINNQLWNRNRVVIQRGLIKWSEDPV